jgi:hypothetical protein
MRPAAHTSDDWPPPELTSLGALVLVPAAWAEEEAEEVAIWGDWLRDPHRMVAETRDH